mgnify:CR=1 FL=1|jgi:hypothetical protein
MTALYFDVGDRVAVTNAPSKGGESFADDDGVHFDPDAVTCIVTDPQGTATTYTYGTDSNLTRLSLGVYRCEFDVDAAGGWRWSLRGELGNGENRGSSSGSFTARA